MVDESIDGERSFTYTKLINISELNMSERQYLKTLNAEIQKLNGVIDNKIMHSHDYRREAQRHKELLRQLRKVEKRRSLFTLPNLFFWA